MPTIVPVRPDLAATSMAFASINIAYTYDNSPQHDPNNPDSGLYINDKSVMDNWAGTGDNWYHHVFQI